MSKRGKDSGMQKRKQKIRMRFRAMIRMVIFNKSWLQDIEEQKVTTNINKNIAMLVRRERKIGVLTLAEKTILRTPLFMRSKADRKKLVELMLNLTCFIKFPPKIRARLGNVVQFINCTPGRTLIRQGSEPIIMYFVLWGEIEVTKTRYDKSSVATEKLEFICGPSDCIGEIEMLEGCPRLFTCTTTRDTELLTLNKDDFDDILRPFMEKQWNEKKLAVRAFEYFNDWDEQQLFYVCKIGSLQQYEPLETIYDEDNGPLTYVHFVISGQCMILQSLKIKVTERNGIKSYALLDTSDEENAALFSDLTEEELMKMLLKGKGGDKPEEKKDDVSSSSEEEEEQEQEEVAGVYKKARKSDFKRYAMLCGVDLRSPAEQLQAASRVAAAQKPQPEQEQAPETAPDAAQDEAPEEAPEGTPDGAPEGAPEPTAETAPDATLETAPEVAPKSVAAPVPGSGQGPTPSPAPSKRELFRLETHFIDVGSLTYGGIFGLGEELIHRVIMARTTVQCLLIPRFWLLEKKQNPGNLWQRKRFYLDSTIPSRKLLYNDFLATRKWEQFKQKVINETLDSSKIGNPTKAQDTPIICRIVEARDNDEKEGS